MRYVKWTVLALIVLIAGLFLHYTLPKYDIVRVVNTEVRRVDFGSNSIFWSHAGSGDATGSVNRDVFFIDAIRTNGKPKVYRNEDTGWIWPPYFKFDSSNLQAIAQDFVSSSADPRWVAVRHYGWRIEWFSIFPNATSMKPVGGPDERVINWFNILFFIALAALIVWIWRVWRNFRESRIDPLLDDIEDGAEDARARGRGWWRRISGR